MWYGGTQEFRSSSEYERDCVSTYLYHFPRRTALDGTLLIILPVPAHLQEGKLAGNSNALRNEGLSLSLREEPH